MISENNQTFIDNIIDVRIMVYGLCNLNYCNQKIKTKTYELDPTRF